MQKSYIGLWRNKPPISPRDKNNFIFPIEYIFPSGRQALSYSLNKVGLSRPNRIALPEWSSHCVISSVGKFTTPIPMNEVIKYKINIDAILLYEQWGWPFQLELKEKLLNIFKNSIIILDRVDSADIDNKNRIRFYPDMTQIDIISLSKLLGLSGGGLAKLNGDYLIFQSNRQDEIISFNIWKDNVRKQNYEKLLRIHMNEFETLHPDLIKWLTKNSLNKALEQEYADRKNNLKAIINSPLSSNWPEWMHIAFKNNVGPSIAPILRNKPEKSLLDIFKYLMENEGVETSIYHFNWSGNQLEPNYEMSLAFPLNGLLKDKIELIIEDIIRTFKL